MLITKTKITFLFQGLEKAKRQENLLKANLDHKFFMMTQ
ncbi:hypothetical protein SDC9_155674 [bioreactor metagenome]|uniref:Uncharacterized protein n=1 Tax=bioreactor metagenome TaxID=1076179 RepID=A0A645F4E7_9ZZZZ